MDVLLVATMQMVGDPQSINIHQHHFSYGISCQPPLQLKKLNVFPGGDAAVFDYATSGPCLGSSDLAIGPPRAVIMGGFAGSDSEDICNLAGLLRQCQSNVGSTYCITCDMKWQQIDVKLYCVNWWKIEVQHSFILNNYIDQYIENRIPYSSLMIDDEVGSKGSCYKL
jgi:hypothetical protein